MTGKTDYEGWSERMPPERRAAARKLLEEANERSLVEYEKFVEDRDRWRKSAVEVLADGHVWWIGDKGHDVHAINDEEESFEIGERGYGDFASAVVLSVRDGAIPLSVLRAALEMHEKIQAHLAAGRAQVAKTLERVDGSAGKVDLSQAYADAVVAELEELNNP